MPVENALVVDDSKSARTMLSRMLTKTGVTVSCVESVDEAFAYLDNAKPDLIFMDHMMPDVDGLHAVRLLASDKRFASIPVVMYTSKEDADYLQQVKEAGAIGVIGKPAHQELVEHVISNVNALLAGQQNEPENETSALSEAVSHGEATRNAFTDAANHADAQALSSRELQSVAEQVESALTAQLHSRVAEAISLRFQEVVGGIKERVSAEIADESLAPLRNRLGQLAQQQQLLQQEIPLEIKKINSAVNAVRESVRSHDAKITDVEYFLSDDAEKYVSRTTLTHELDTLKAYVEEELKRQQLSLAQVSTPTSANVLLDLTSDEYRQLVNTIVQAVRSPVESHIEETLKAVNRPPYEVLEKHGFRFDVTKGVMAMAVLSTIISLTVALIVLV